MNAASYSHLHVEAYIAAEVPPGMRGRIAAQIASTQKWAVMSLPLQFKMQWVGDVGVKELI